MWERFNEVLMMGQGLGTLCKSYEVLWSHKTDAKTAKEYHMKFHPSSLLSGCVRHLMLLATRSEVSVQGQVSKFKSGFSGGVKLNCASLAQTWCIQMRRMG